MGLPYRWFGRPLLRIQDSEKAHLRSLKLLRLSTATAPGRWILRQLYRPRHSLPVNVFGQTYRHPLGLAAGMDKNGIGLRGWSTIGLAFVEIGGVTMLPQQGNPKPRMFRANNSQALVNRMGFNNEGSESIRDRLETYTKRYGRLDVPLWVNLGKSKITPLEEAHVDYATSLERLWLYADVFVVNVSSPNTPQLRELQNNEELKRILSSCHEANHRCAVEYQQLERPILVKIAPDVTSEQLNAIVSTAKEAGASGIVVCNTTVERPDLVAKKDASVFAQAGGMSGQPLKERSTQLIREVRSLVGPDWPIIGVGGIGSALDAWEKLEAGATLLQAYSGYVFKGPSLTSEIVSGLHKRLIQHGYNNINEVGND
jgi:dihydroorotate dehydrogenase